MAVKKKVTKKSKKSTPDIDIKVRNLGSLKKMIKEEDKKKKCHGGHCSGFWVFGSALAMILSYERTASILYSILHGILSWFYILYRAMQIWGWF